MMSNRYEVLFSDLQIVLLFFALYPVQSLLLWINTHRESAGPGCQDTVLNWQLIRRETFWRPPVGEGKPSKFNSNKIITELYSLHSKILFLEPLKFSQLIQFLRSSSFESSCTNSSSFFYSLYTLQFSEFPCKDLYTYLLTSTSLVSSSSSLNGSLSGTSLLCRSSTQSVYTISLRNSQLKAPT